MAEATPSGSGSIHLSGPPDDGFLMIRGGVGGISFQLEELTGGAEKLDDLAGELSELEVEIRRIWEGLVPFQDLPRWSGSLAINAVGESGRSIQRVRAELQRISSQVRACKQEYETAEWLAGTARYLGIVSPGDIYNSLANFAANRAADDKTAETIVGVLGLQAADVKRRVGRDPLGWDALERDGAVGRPLTVRQEESVQVDLDTSPAGLLERIRQIDARGAGFIEVIEVTNGGEKTYVVVVPGTQSAGIGAGGKNPFDEVGILEAMVYSSEDMSVAALQALKAAGAEYGAPVVAVGYSQGGIHAMNLAADPRFLHDYDLRYVLTAGSPVAGINPAAGVQSLHLEHREDWVPGTDGAPNPDTKERVTVGLTQKPRALEGEGALGPGHTLNSYQDGARLVSASTDPSLVASTAALGAALGAGGTATATRFSLSRTKAPASDLHAADNRRQERGYGGR
ncbi:hypothetical protein FBY31_2649 [Arthrobacter sp. SLBN-100]|uniref:hypothetical protein n=1 Tax=Arthrobacter sp. SLBN-100 TaxID=2768450 RepID=UPI00114E89EC|nr:hypothetical protein [Arthrobacter sp. SLBN-100]TQJ68543.1 hypothetical protein FBY31_2649 [Arthrobacter sp. SLBN-100]